MDRRISTADAPENGSNARGATPANTPEFMCVKANRNCLVIAYILLRGDSSASRFRRSL